MKRSKIITLLCLTALLSGCEIIVNPNSNSSQPGNSSESQTSEPGSVSSEESQESQGGQSEESSQVTESQGGGTSTTSQEESQTTESTTQSDSQGGEPIPHDGLSPESAFTVEEMLVFMKDYTTTTISETDIYVTGKCVDDNSYVDLKNGRYSYYFENHTLDSEKPFQMYSGVFANGDKSRTSLAGCTLTFHGKAFIFVKNNKNIYEIGYKADVADNPVIDLVDGEQGGGGSSTSESTTPTSESTSPTSESSQPGTSEDFSGDTLAGDPIETDPVAQDYYKNISKTATGEALRSELHTLINKNRCTTGYKALWGYYPYSDANPDNPSENSVVAFYNGTADKNYSSTMNKEHVWPDSRGGNLVEGDPHMTRPTFSKDNSSRGNSFYVEGRNSSSNGWDPKAAGMNENYRGDAARIIFYCAVMNNSLTLVDKDTDDKNNNTMGKLSDLIKWNYEYPISKYERLRNEVLSGETSVKGSNYNFNRNPFIDDRSYVCRIWGNTNSETQRLCKLYTEKTKPTSITLSDESLTITSFEPYQLTVASVTPAGAYDKSVATIDHEGYITALKNGTTTITATSTEDSSVTATCNVTVELANVDLAGITVQSALNLNKGQEGKISVDFTPATAYPKPSLQFVSSNTSIATVNSNGEVVAVGKGSTEINVTATQGSIVKHGVCVINVTEASGFVKLTTAPSNWEGSYLIVNENSSKVFNSGITDINKSPNSMSVTIKNGSIEVSDATSSAMIIVEKIGGEYLMKTSDGQVIKANGKNIEIDAEGTTRTTFALDGSNVIITSGSTYTLQYNSSADLFRYYNTNQQPVCLYKLS